MTGFVSVRRGDAPLIVSIPHAGTQIPAELEEGFVSQALALHDADHHVDRLYGFATALGATIVATAISRTVIDVNRDPSGQSLYPGQVTTGLCPETCFDGTPLYKPGCTPDADEVARRRAVYFDPYHGGLEAEIERLRQSHRHVVLYDAHSILGRVPRLFEGELPQFNIGTFDGRSCAPELAEMVAGACSGETYVVNGRFKGGWITRHYGNPGHGVHAIQMELAMRGYLDEGGVWPPVWDAGRAAPLQARLRNILTQCLDFARTKQ